MAIYSTADPGMEAALRALAHEDRRAIVRELAAGARSLDLTASGSLDLSASRVELHHRHLPMLAECGVVDWDPDDRSVARGPQFQVYEPLIDSLETVEDCTA